MTKLDNVCDGDGMFFPRGAGHRCSPRLFYFNFIFFLLALPSHESRLGTFSRVAPSASPTRLYWKMGIPGRGRWKDWIGL